MISSVRRLLAGVLATATLIGAPAVSMIPGAAASAGEGPHASPTRPRAATTTTRRGGVVIRDVDLGNAELGRTKGAFRTPVRGLLVTPDKLAAHAPLIIVAHLRYAGCADRVYAYPCRGKELRLDRGMTYLGESLARQGYSVLIPDLAPLYVSSSPTFDYDQYAGFRTVVGRLRDEALAASAGRATAFGAGLKGAVDARRVGLAVHSRSGLMAGAAVAAWARTSTPVTSVLAYGPVYETPDEKGRFTPMVPDVPYLSAIGDLDHDVAYSSQLWLTEHVGTVRRSPALVAVVPGLGHSYVNRELSARKLDDRLDCTPATCPGAPAHERFLATTAAQWFDATVRGRRSALPLIATAALPASLSGLPARWLAVTNAPHASLYLGGVRGSMRLIGKGATLRWCRYVDPMNPDRPAGTCPDAPAGSVQNASRVSQVRLTPTGGVRVAVSAKQAHELALHVSPTGDRADHGRGNPIRVVVRTSSGHTHTVDLPATHPALRDRATADRAGTYTTGTIRIPLPAWISNTTVTAIDLTGGPATSALDIRAIDLATH